MRKGIFIVLVVIVLGYNCFGHAQNSYNEIRKSGVLRVGTTGDYAPVTYWSKSENKYIGLDIDIVESFAKYLDLNIEFVRTSWQTLTQDLLDNKFDIAVGGITATKERNEYFLFSNPIMETGKVLLILKKNKTKYKNLEDVDRYGVWVVANNGGTNMQFALKNIKQAFIAIVPQNAMNFQFLLEGKADAFFTDKIEALYKEKNNPEFYAVNPDAPYSKADIVFLIPKSDNELQSKINDYLKIINENGEHHRLLQKALETKYN